MRQYFGTSGLSHTTALKIKKHFLQSDTFCKALDHNFAVFPIPLQRKSGGYSVMRHLLKYIIGILALSLKRYCTKKRQLERLRILRYNAPERLVP